MQNSTETNDAIGEFKESTAATADTTVTFGDDLVLEDVENILFARGVVGEDGDLEYQIAEQKSPERPIPCTKSNTINSNVVLPSNWHMTVDELFDYCRAQVTFTINHPTPRVFSFLACGQVYVVFMSTTMQQLIIANAKDPAFILDKTYGTTRVADALQHIGLPHGVVVGLLVACDNNHSLVNRERRIQYPQPIVTPWQNPPLPVQPFVSQITPIVHHSPYNSFNAETLAASTNIFVDMLNSFENVVAKGGEEALNSLFNSDIKTILEASKDIYPEAGFKVDNIYITYDFDKSIGFMYTAFRPIKIDATVASQTPLKFVNSLEVDKFTKGLLLNAFWLIIVETQNKKPQQKAD